MRHVSPRPVAGGEAPRISAVSGEVLWVGDTVCAIDQGNVAVVFKVRRSVAVVQAVRVKSEVGIVCEEERASGSNADVEFYPVVRLPIAVVVSCRASRPASAIAQRG